VNLIEWEDLENVVICGHSYGGMVITGAIDRVGSRIRAAVFLDAFVPSDGASLWDHLPEPLRERFLAAAAGGDFVPPPPAASFLVNEADRAWVDAKCTPQPMKTFTEPVGAVAAREAVPTKVYVSATAYDSPAFAPFVAALREDPTWSVLEIAAGHDLEIDTPDRVAEIVLAAAA
jgi:pimeloyl-ACP methyl ester carboxylesterase